MEVFWVEDKKEGKTWKLRNRKIRTYNQKRGASKVQTTKKNCEGKDGKIEIIKSDALRTRIVIWNSNILFTSKGDVSSKSTPVKS
jgi:hypothetical protein